MHSPNDLKSGSSESCPQCGGPIPDGAVLLGHCPRCLAACSGDEVFEQWTATLHSLAARFPQFGFCGTRAPEREGSDYWQWQGRAEEGGETVFLRLRDAGDEQTVALEDSGQLKALDHPNIARLHSHGADGRFIFTIIGAPPGDCLSDVLRRGGLSQLQLRNLREPVQEAWSYARQRGVHLPVTPEHVWLEKSGRPLLTGLDCRGDGRFVWLPEKEMEGDAAESGRTIGPYRLLQRIGEGGFGWVYRARRSRGIQRDVALKVIKAGMDTRQVIARFEAERRALALMNHPNIAQVIDAGETSEGRPYFVMELVRDATPISTYCEDALLEVPERLRLLMRVCRAVQHAHRKGILHRDLKPSNILIAQEDGEAVPKVIDFGIAKALRQELTDETLLTRYEQIVGTPAYMSPEQAALSGDVVDTRSDVYALGVLLYQLLTGTTPFEAEALKAMPLDQMVRTLRETVPVKPSRRVERSRLPRELDWIVMKALEKEPERRYDSAGELARDVERFLAGEVVEAGPAGAGYRLGRLLRQHRTAVVAAGAVLLAVVGGALLAVWGFFRAEASEAQARQEAEAAQAINRFLREDLLMQANPTVSPERDLKLRVAVDRAAERIAERFGGQPLVEADVRMTLAGVYEQLAEDGAAFENARRAADLRLSALGPDHRETLRAQSFQAGILAHGEYFTPEREALLLSVFERQWKLFGAHDVDTLHSFERIARGYKESDRDLENSEVFKRYPFPDPVKIPREGAARETVLSLCLFLERIPEVRSDQVGNREGDHLRGFPAVRRVLKLAKAELGALHPISLEAEAVEAIILMQSSQLEEAQDGERRFKALLPTLHRVFGSVHEKVVLGELFFALHLRGRVLDKTRESVERQRALYERVVAHHGELAEESLEQLAPLIMALTALDDRVGLDEAEAARIGELLEELKTTLFTRLQSPPVSAAEVKSLRFLGDAFRAYAQWMGDERWEHALACNQRVTELVEPVDEGSRFLLAFSYDRMGTFYLQQAFRGRDRMESLAAAEEMLMKALELFRTHYPKADDGWTRDALFRLSHVVRLGGDPERIEAFIRAWIEEILLDEDMPYPQLTWLNQIYAGLGEFARGADFYARTLEKYRPELRPDEVAFYTRRAALCALMVGDEAAYRAHGRQIVTQTRQEPAVDGETTIPLLLALGARDSGHLEEAAEILELCRQNPTERRGAYRLAAALLQCRKGEWAGARETLGKMTKTRSRTELAGSRSLSLDVKLSAIQAMAYQGEGKAVEARLELEEAEALMRLAFLQGLHVRFWPTWAYASLLTLEAKEAVTGETFERDFYWRDCQALSRIDETLVPLVGRQATWKFLHPEDGADPALGDPDFHTTFFQPDFDDEHWSEGSEGHGDLSGFGYGFPKSAVRWKAPEKGKRKSAYLRHRFTTDNEYESLKLMLDCDDGVILHLDGREVARIQVPSRLDESYELTAGSEFSLARDHEGAWWPVRLEGKLAPGAHVLAISLHNRLPDSSDLRVGNVTLYGRPVERDESVESPSQESSP